VAYLGLAEGEQGKGVWETEVPQWGPGESPARGLWVKVLQKLKHLIKSYIKVFVSGDEK